MTVDYRIDFGKQPGCLELIRTVCQHDRIVMHRLGGLRFKHCIQDHAEFFL